MTRKPKNAVMTALLGLCCFLMACERVTHVKIEGTNTPIFLLSGSGNLCALTVYSPDYAEKAKSPWDEDLALWKIEQEDGHRALAISELGRITYGTVPEGYRQIKPAVGTAGSLREGEKYYYDVVATNAPGASGYLQIRNSRAVAADGTYPCFGRENNKWIRIPCPK